MRHAGFTLWELVCTLAIAGVVFGLGVPSFQTFILDGKRTADVNGFVLAVQVARSEAAKRDHDITVCATTDTQRCTDFEQGAPRGWMAFVNTDGTYPPHRSATEPLLFVHETEMTGTIIANRPYFELRPLFHRSINGTVVFCDARGPSAARAVIVSFTGRPRVDTVAADGRRLDCA
jgi:type IV fimbrial biogenesis protein FimT